MSFLTCWNLLMNAQSFKSAYKLFNEGKFIESRVIFSAILAKHPDHLKALLYMGYIDQLANRTDESARWFDRAKIIKPGMQVLNSFMAENYHRQKQFDQSASYYRLAGREAMAKKMEGFSTLDPYKINPGFDIVKIKFIVTDPLPVIEVTVNREHTGYFFIDTGGGELILDESFAKKVKAESFGVEKGSEFGGGKKAPVGHGKVASVTLAGLVMENIPIITIDLSRLELGGYKIDGCIGTVFLYQFLSTIDYRNGQLILRNKEKYSLENLMKNSLSPKIIPFVLADDHFMMARGSVNNSDTMQFFVDTGLAGNAFTCPKSTLQKAGLNYNRKKGSKALGGGGYFMNYPMEIEKLCLGDVCVNNLHGIYGAFPPQIEKSFGFAVNGLISHEFFRNHALTIDFEGMKFLLTE